jgi:hypothetical protein
VEAIEAQRSKTRRKKKVGLLKSVGKSEAADSTRLDLPALETFPGIQEAKEQVSITRAQLSENESKAKRIQENLALRAHGVASSVSIRDRAEALLRGQPFSTDYFREQDLIACRDEHAVIAEACVIATDSLREKVGAASIQVCKQFSAEHQSRVKKIADCAIALAEAFVSEADLRRQIVGAGFELTHPISGFPMLGNTIGRPADPNSALGYFLKALRAKGIEI